MAKKGLIGMERGYGKLIWVLYLYHTRIYCIYFFHNVPVTPRVW